MIKLIALKILLFVLSIINISLKLIAFTLKVIVIIVKWVSFIPIFLVAFILSVVFRLLGFLVFMIVDGSYTGYTAGRDEIGKKARARRLLRRFSKDLAKEKEKEDSTKIYDSNIGDIHSRN
ncbi:hypothetical protein LCGC14_1266110 [marine sediment metagenome]|uniref:Uncharacterized protein n=1 Tax=marine sediment metagenome TaxID=412755 RepID=A0A0F9LKI3_9ZZZZ